MPRDDRDRCRNGEQQPLQVQETFPTTVCPRGGAEPSAAPAPFALALYGLHAATGRAAPPSTTSTAALISKARTGRRKHATQKSISALQAILMATVRLLNVKTFAMGSRAHSPCPQEVAPLPPSLKSY